MFCDAFRSNIGLRHLVDHVAGLAAFRVHRVLELITLGDIERCKARGLAVVAVRSHGVRRAHELFVRLPIGINLSLLCLGHTPRDVNARLILGGIERNSAVMQACHHFETPDLHEDSVLPMEITERLHARPLGRPEF